MRVNCLTVSTAVSDAAGVMITWSAENVLNPPGAAKDDFSLGTRPDESMHMSI